MNVKLQGFSICTKRGLWLFVICLFNSLSCVSGWWIPVLCWAPVITNHLYRVIFWVQGMLLYNMSNSLRKSRNSVGTKTSDTVSSPVRRTVLGEGCRCSLGLNRDRNTVRKSQPDISESSVSLCGVQFCLWACQSRSFGSRPTSWDMFLRTKKGTMCL